MSSISKTLSLVVGAAQVHLRDVRLSQEIIVDEIHLDGGDINITASGEEISARAAETKFHVMMSEPHINALLEAGIPADAPVRSLRVALLSGKIRITGQVIKSVLHLPFTLEAIPIIENGIRVRLDCQAAKLGAAGGLGLPALVVELIEQHINNNPALPLDLSRLPVPVRLDEIRCEPGRLNVSGRARLQWPLATTTPAIAPFSPRQTPDYLLPDASPSGLLPAEQSPTAESELPALPSTYFK